MDQDVCVCVCALRWAWTITCKPVGHGSMDRWDRLGIKDRVVYTWPDYGNAFSQYRNGIFLFTWLLALGNKLGGAAGIDKTRRVTLSTVRWRPYISVWGQIHPSNRGKPRYAYLTLIRFLWFPAFLAIVQLSSATPDLAEKFRSIPVRLKMI